MDESLAPEVLGEEEEAVGGVEVLHVVLPLVRPAPVAADHQVDRAVEEAVEPVEHGADPVQLSRVLELAAARELGLSVREVPERARGFGIAAGIQAVGGGGRGGTTARAVA